MLRINLKCYSPPNNINKNFLFALLYFSWNPYLQREKMPSKVCNVIMDESYVWSIAKKNLIATVTLRWTVFKIAHLYLGINVDTGLYTGVGPLSQHLASQSVQLLNEIIIFNVLALQKTSFSSLYR